MQVLALLRYRSLLSGCVTSAETVLVQQQSVDSFTELLKVGESLRFDS